MDPCRTRLSQKGIRDPQRLLAAIYCGCRNTSVPAHTRSHFCATAGLKHLVHGCMVCCSRILVGIDDLSPIKDKESALQVPQQLNAS